MKKKIRHFLNINNLSTKEMLLIIKQGHFLKKNYGRKFFEEKKILAMIFEKPSTRTRVSFEVGMKKLNGDVVVLDQHDSQLGRGESLQDTIKVLGRYVDIILYRGSDEKKLYEISESSNVPIINGLTNNSHPCQIIADIMTLEENFKDINKLEICWVGDGNNVCNSWIEAASHYNFKLNISCPEDCFPSEKILKNSKSSQVSLFEKPSEAVKNVDVIITDTWESMGIKKDKQKLEKFEKFRVDAELMSKTNKNSFFLHCLPAHRGCEVTDEIIDGKNSLVWDEAQNRLYAHQSILMWCLEKF
jgi:ornithine carbamoyltransferase